MESTPRLSLGKRFVFAVIPLLLIVLAAEAIARLPRGGLLGLQNYRLLRLELSRRGYPAVHDDRLGYVPRPRYSSRDNFWGTQVTIDADGMRSNGRPTPPGKPIVAVGDSFTFGDQVNDHESWPAYLEGELRRPVRNGGVFGYSLGQSVLRAEEILDRVSAEWLIVSFFPADIERCEYSKRYTHKPYFEIVEGNLVVHNVPVPTAVQTAEERRARRFKNALGYSALIDSVLAHRPGLKAWWYMDDKDRRVHPVGTGVEIATLLVDRAEALCRSRGCRLVLVLQGAAPDADSSRVLSRAEQIGVPTLDLVAAFLEEKERDPEVQKRYFDGHMTAEGNAWVARHLAEYLLRLEGSPAREGAP